jgi:hypothetical protein
MPPAGSECRLVDGAYQEVVPPQPLAWLLSTDPHDHLR